jgi:serine/threonine protein kinase
MSSEAPTKKPQESLTDADLNKKWEGLADYQLIRKSNDPRFGEITIYKHKNEIQLIFSKEKVVSSKQQEFLDIKDLQARAELNHPFIQEFLGYSTSVDKQLCTVNYVSTGYYKFPKQDLNKEIQEKSKTNNSFTASELKFIKHNIAHALRFLHGKGIAHGDIRPLQILYNIEKGQVQLLDRLNDPSPVERAQQNNLTFKRDMYMSPELYKRLQGRDKLQKYNPFKNDTWALGLTLLQAGLLKSVQDIYEPKGTINEAKLREYLDNFNQLYSADSQLVVNVRGLLDLNEDTRFDAFLGHPHDASKVDNFHKSIVHAHVQSALPSEEDNEEKVHPILNDVKGKLITVVTQDGHPLSYIQTKSGRNVVYEGNSVQTSGVQGNVSYTPYQRLPSYSPVPGIEVRKGSATPNKSENVTTKNKKYVIQGDKLIEVSDIDPDAQNQTKETQEGN